MNAHCLLWRIERMSPHGFRTTCFLCDAEFTVDLAAAVFRYGPTLLGISCSDCLPPAGRQELVAMIGRVRVWLAKEAARVRAEQEATR